MAIHITVVGPIHLYKARNNAKIGDNVKLLKHRNKKFPTAILAVDESGEELGQVAASDKTTLTGVILDDIYELFPDEFNGKIISLESTGLILEVEEETKKVEEKKGGITMNLNNSKSLVEGTKLQCPKRFSKELIESLREKKPYPCKLVEADDNIFVSIEDSAGEGFCGFISADKVDGFENLENVKGIFKARRNAKGLVEHEAVLTGLDERGLKMVLEVEYTGKTALEEALNRVQKEGILTQKEVQKRVKWFPKTLPEKNLIKIFENMKEAKNKDRVPTGDFVFMNNNNILERVFAAFNAGKNILFEGPKASGKTVATIDIARFANQELYEMQVSGDIDSETILGSKTIKTNEDGTTEIVFQPSPLVQAMENDGIIVIDEINTGHPSVMTLLHSILDGRRRIDVPSYGTVIAGPNFRVFATMNRDYQGTFELNEALKSRFVPILFKEPENIKDILKKSVPEAEMVAINFSDKIYKDVRKKVMISEWGADVINIRGFIDALDMTLWGIDIKTALKSCVADGCDDIDTQQAVSMLIDTIKL